MTSEFKEAEGTSPSGDGPTLALSWLIIESAVAQVRPVC